jgi:hypothetical protein
MALSEVTSIEQVIVNDLGSVQYKTATKILRDDVEISKTFHITVLRPGQDLSGCPDNVVAICNTVWTPEVLAAEQQREQELIAQAIAEQGVTQ